MICSFQNSVAYTFSEWVAGWLPIQYELVTDKFPVNTFDEVNTISGITNNNGLAKITLFGTSETYVNREYIQITNSSLGYNGVYQILGVTGSTVFTLDTPFLGNEIGIQFQRYYRNYHLSVNVYAGIRSGHSLESDNPIGLVGTLEVRPDDNNTAIVDISSYIRNELGFIENDLCSALNGGNLAHGNDTKMWTQFYIAYAESYDISDGSTVSTFLDDYENDLSSEYGLNIFGATRSALQFQDPQGRSIGSYAIADTDPDSVPAQFMTEFERPRYFPGKEYDISIIIAFSNDELATEGFGLEYVLKEYDSINTLLTTDTSPIDMQDEGVYRFSLSEYPLLGATTKVELFLQTSTGTKLSETKTIKVDREVCKGRGDIYLRWLNSVGGFDGWFFNRNHDYTVRVGERKVVRRNIYKNWDDVFVNGQVQDAYFDTESFQSVNVKSQFLSDSEADGLEWLIDSNQVFECFETTEEGCNKFKCRGVLIDPGEYQVRTDRDKLNRISFSFRYTDRKQLPGQ